MSIQKKSPLNSLNESQKAVVEVSTTPRNSKSRVAGNVRGRIAGNIKGRVAPNVKGRIQSFSFGASN